MAEGKASRRQSAVLERDIQALELKKAGASYQMIAKSLGYSSDSGAYKAVQRRLKALNRQAANDAAELRRLEVERLDRLMVGVWPSATQGHLGAVDRVVKIIERRSRLLGLDAPVKEEHQVSGSLQVERLPADAKEAQAFLDRVLGSRHQEA